MLNLNKNQKAYAGILVAALGYFVDAFDLLLFSIVRVTSLKEIGVPEAELLSTGAFILNVQMTGLMVGGVLWGVWGDKRGRISVLFGSILLYSVANIVNGFVHSVPVYAVVRFIAGVGLAGELGAGITLVAESLPKESRGIGTTIVAALGVLGVVFAGLIGEMFHWRTLYFIGGVMGFALLVLRVAAHESDLFHKVAGENVAKGDFFMLFRSKERFLKFVLCILLAIPLWFVVGVLITFSPEISTALGMPEKPSPAKALIFCYSGIAAGDLASGILSQVLQSRKKAMAIFMTMNALFITCYLTLPSMSLTTFYTICTCLGFSIGYWAVFVTNAAEQFGTNLRATVATSAPNFVRWSTVPATTAFAALKEPLGIIGSAATVGAIYLALAAIALWKLEETFHRDLNYLEE